jgi:hypothetical protein
VSCADALGYTSVPHRSRPRRPAQQSDGAFPTWSPSGERIAYRVREEGDRDVLHVANANGSGDVPLPGLANVRVYN